MPRSVPSPIEQCQPLVLQEEAIRSIQAASGGAPATAAGRGEVILGYTQSSRFGLLLLATR